MQANLFALGRVFRSTLFSDCLVVLAGANRTRHTSTDLYKVAKYVSWKGFVLCRGIFWGM